MEMIARVSQSRGISFPALRIAQEGWEEQSLRERLAIIRRFRHALVEEAPALARQLASCSGVSSAEKMVSEIFPLAEAARWLERNARKLLKPRNYGRSGRPYWLGRVSVKEQRKPFGVVLVIAPANYPLFLPAVQTLQALVAGNAVLWKPAPETGAIALRCEELLLRAGLQRSLLTILPDTVTSIYHAIESGVDKVIFTGSSSHGRELLAALARTNTPAILELSGEDPVLVLEDADLQLLLQAVRFGLRLNRGETCIAPRRIIARRPLEVSLRRFLSPDDAGKLHIIGAEDESELIRLANDSAYGLGASIFSRDLKAAQRVAAQLQTGFVTINDLIVPTADPRIPFGGIKASGFGSTRGAEGLLAMTHPHVIATRHNKHPLHFQPVTDADSDLLAAALHASHGSPTARLWALGRLLVAIRRRTPRPENL